MAGGLLRFGHVFAQKKKDAKNEKRKKHSQRESRKTERETVQNEESAASTFVHTLPYTAVPPAKIPRKCPTMNIKTLK